MSPTRFAVVLAAILLVAAGLRVMFPTADPPTNPAVGVVWHDEGGWVHNARNRVLFGAWRLDEWNPAYITPVLTGLEYISFEILGVGLRQARLVSQVAGILSVLLFGLGLARLGGRRTGLVGAALLATNYAYVMYDRAATVEATMIAFMVAAWYGYLRAYDSPRWGLAAGVAAILAYFTKASAAFLVASIGLDALLTLATVANARGVDRTIADPALARRSRAAALYTIAGLAGSAVAALAVFVLPNWTEYRFYNWQMSVTRKPSYALGAIIGRLSWVPVVHAFFTRMWVVTLLAVTASLDVLARIREVHPGRRLLFVWLGLGVAELAIHDVGNERYFVFLIPALVGLAALAVAADRRLLSPEVASLPFGRMMMAAPVAVFGLFLVFGSAVRQLFLADVGAGRLAPAIRVGAALAIVSSAAIYLTWPRIPRWLGRVRWNLTIAGLLVCLVVAGDLVPFAYWAIGRTYRNYTAMKLIGDWLPPGTLVHGKLANGLALENRIRPIFVGQEFGNYNDRTTRDDVRFLLTCIQPYLGYESGHKGLLIREILDAYPGWRFVRTFAVAESAGGQDRAALIDKTPSARSQGPPGTGIQDSDRHP